MPKKYEFLMFIVVVVDFCCWVVRCAVDWHVQIMRIASNEPWCVTTATHSTASIASLYFHVIDICIELSIQFFCRDWFGICTISTSFATTSTTAATTTTLSLTHCKIINFKVKRSENNFEGNVEFFFFWFWQKLPCFRGCGRLWVLFWLNAGRGVRTAAWLTSDTANWMFIGRPSNGTPLYCFMAFTASARRSNTTSAVPRNYKTNKKLLVHVRQTFVWIYDNFINYNFNLSCNKLSFILNVCVGFIFARTKQKENGD